MKPTPGYWALLALTLAVYAAMLFWSFPAIRAEAGGLTALDLRVTGYDHGEVQAFLAALSEEGRALYAGWHGSLDAIAPGLLFATMAIALWALSEGWQRTTRIMLVVVAAIGMGADFFENMRIREMLIAGPEGVTPEMVSAASFLTVVKSASLLVSVVALALLVAAHLRKRAG